jgi:hypothetical protein
MSTCICCDVELPIQRTGRPRKYCSDECRQEVRTANAQAERSVERRAYESLWDAYAASKEAAGHS